MKPIAYSAHICLCLVLVACVQSQFNFRTKDLKIEKSGPCPDEASNAIRMVNYTNMRVAHNLLHMNSDIIVERNITGSLTMKIMKCTLDLNRCDYYDTYKVNDLCAKIAMTNAMWSPYVNSIHPALVCPIQAGAYKIVNGTFDYTMASRLPIDGNRWITDMKVFETLANNNGTTGKPAGKRTQVWCLDSDVRITLSKNTRSRKRN